jgi:hypothetical protein
VKRSAHTRIHPCEGPARQRELRSSTLPLLRKTKLAHPFPRPE